MNKIWRFFLLNLHLYGWKPTTSYDYPPTLGWVIDDGRDNHGWESGWWAAKQCIIHLFELLINHNRNLWTKFGDFIPILHLYGWKPTTTYDYPPTIGWAIKDGLYNHEWESGWRAAKQLVIHLFELVINHDTTHEQYLEITNDCAPTWMKPIEKLWLPFSSWMSNWLWTR